MPELSELPEIFQLTDKFRKQVLANERASAVRLVNAYGDVYQKLQPQIDALVAELTDNPDMKVWKKLKLKRLRELKSQVENEVGRFANYLDVELNTGARAAIAATG